MGTKDLTKENQYCKLLNYHQIQGLLVHLFCVAKNDKFLQILSRQTNVSIQKLTLKFRNTIPCTKTIQ